MRYAYKRMREQGRRMRCYRGEFAPGHPVFPAGSAAAVPAAPDGATRPSPVAVDSPDIVYTSADDDAIDELLKAQSKCLTAMPELLARY